MLKYHILICFFLLVSVYFEVFAETLVFHLPDERIIFIQVEVARTDKARQTGLMGRHELADNAGLLLLYPKPRTVAIWMKNTYLPLDIIFITEDMRIARIAQGAEPHSLQLIPSHVKVIAVLEVNAGYAHTMQLKPGTPVSLCQSC